MNITREQIDGLNGIIRINVEPSDYESKIDEVLKDYKKKVNMPGFRPGKVPFGLVKKMYGKAALVEEVNKILSHELSKYLVEEKLNILGEPLPSEDQQKDIDWEQDSSFEFTFDIGMAPEANVKLDKRSKFKEYEIEISEEMIDEQVKAYASRFGENKKVDAIEDSGTVRGNIVQLDQEGKEKEDGAKVEMALISIDAIKDEEIKKNFIGRKVDEEIVFDIKKAYPNDTEISYLLNIEKELAAEISGDFKITVKEINKFVPADINEELYSKIYGEETEIKDEKAFQAKVKEEIAAAYKPSIEYRFLLDARDLIIEKASMEFPEAFLKRWLAASNKELTQEQIDRDFEMFLDDLKWQIIKDDIAKENELKVEESEVEDLAKEVAAAQFRQYGMFDVPEEHLKGFVQQMLSKEEDRNRLYTKKLEDKVMEVVKSKVSVVQEKISKEDFDKLFEN